jgi:hypothetical protein
VLHRGQLALQRGVPGQQISRFHAVLAGQLLDSRKALLNLFLASGVEFQGFQVMG